MSSIDFLSSVSSCVTIYFGMVNLIGGCVGNMLNLLVFLSLKTFRENSCAFYLTMMSLLNIGQLLTSVLPRVVDVWFTTDWADSSLPYCKFRAYWFQVCSLTSFTCICLATIDQFLATCSNPRWQRYCNVKFAYCCFTVFFLIWLLHGIPTLIYQTHIASGSSGGVRCDLSNADFRKYTNFGITLTFTSTLPIVLTALFGLMAFYNVSQIAYRAIPLVRRELDKQLTSIVLVQVAFNFIVIIPYIITYMINISVTLTRNTYDYALFQLMRTITLNLFYLYFASPFYIYICVSTRFRKQLVHVLCGIYIKKQLPTMVAINHVSPTDGL